MVFLVTALKVYYVLDLELSSLSEPTPNDSEELKKKRKKCEEDELICRRHILNKLTGCLYDLYSNLKTQKEIWTLLETAYRNEKQDIDKFLTLQYFELKIFDTKPIMD